MTLFEEVIVRLGLDTTGFQNTSNKFSSKLNGISNAWSQALVAGGIITGINSIINKMDDLGDKADNLGISTDFLQGMQHIASQDAVGGIKTFDRAIIELSVRLGEAKIGNEAAIATFAKWGITAAEMKSMSADEMFLRIADAIKAIPDASQRSAAAFELLGKSGKNLTGILAAGTDALKERIGATAKLDAEGIASLSRAKAQLEGMSNSAIIGLARVLNYLTNDIPRALVDLKLNDFNWYSGLFGNKAEKTAAPNTGELAVARRDRDARVKANAEIVEAERVAKIQSIIKVATAEKAAADKLHAEALAKIKEKRDADMASLAQKRRDLSASRNSEFLPTVEELANTGIYQQDAQRLQWLEADAKDAALFGDKRGRANDLAEIQSIRSRLSAAGVYQDPNQGTIDAINDLSAKTLKVDVVNAD